MGTEELAHLEMVSAILHQLTRNMSIDEIKKTGFDTYFVDHTAGVYPQFASGTPWSAETIASTGDVIADLNEDLAADATTAKEQPALLKTENRWYYRTFGTLKLFTKMAYLQSRKNHLALIYTIFTKFTIGQAVSQKRIFPPDTDTSNIEGVLF